MPLTTAVIDGWSALLWTTQRLNSFVSACAAEIMAHAATAAIPAKTLTCRYIYFSHWLTCNFPETPGVEAARLLIFGRLVDSRTTISGAITICCASTACLPSSRSIRQFTAAVDKASIG